MPPLAFVRACVRPQIWVVEELLGFPKLCPCNVPARAVPNASCVLSFRVGLKEGDVELAIQRRAEARQNKDYAAADSVRLEMEARGIQIMDTAAGTTWRPSSPKASDAAS